MVKAVNHVVKPDLRALTGLRGIAAWLVVFYHIRSGMGGYLPEPVMAFFAKGYLAVDFFFLLSGFVIWLNYSARFGDSGLQQTLGFYWRRVARIWPLHLFILAVTAVFAAVLVATDRDATGYPIAELPMHIFLMQNWGFTTALSWNHPAWSISTEMAAYLLFPFLAIGFRWERFSAQTLALLMIILAAILHIYFSQRGYQTLGDDIPQTGLFRCLVQFAMGTMICVLWQRWRGDQAKAAIFGAIAFSLFIANLATPVPETFIVPLCFASFLLAMAIWAESTQNPLGKGFIHYLGEISYATYLAHFMLFIAFKIIFVSDPAKISPLLIALFLVLTFVVSAALYHWVEKPGQRLFLSMSLAGPATAAKAK